jgi:uncharacterized membrane protein
VCTLGGRQTETDRWMDGWVEGRNWIELDWTIYVLCVCVYILISLYKIDVRQVIQYDQLSPASQLDRRYLRLYADRVPASQTAVR